MRTAGGHPSKKTFQAIRIACNRELDVLKDSLDMMVDLLQPGEGCVSSPFILWKIGSSNRHSGLMKIPVSVHRSFRSVYAGAGQEGP